MQNCIYCLGHCNELRQAARYFFSSDLWTRLTTSILVSASFIESDAATALHLVIALRASGIAICEEDFIVIAVISLSRSATMTCNQSTRNIEVLYILKY